MVADLLTDAAAVIERLRVENDEQNDDIIRLLSEVVRLRAVRNAIDALHQPDPDYYSPRDRQMCLNCDLEWPCPTYELLHHQDARRG
jgi:hypothetical protein